MKTDAHIPRQSILRQTMLSSLLVILIALGSLIAAYAAFSERVFRGQLAREASSLANSLARESAFAVLVDNRRELQAKVENALILDAVAHVTIRNSDGDPLAQATRGGLDSAALGQKGVSRAFTEVSVPILSRSDNSLMEWESDPEPRTLGSVRVVYSFSERQSLLWQILGWSALIAFVAFLAAFGIQFACVRRLLRPLRELIVFTHRVGAGDLTGKATVHCLDEIGDLTLAFNRMVENLRASQDLEVQVREAKEANRLKSEFLANMSHEIRTPMNGILGMADLALATEQGAEQKEYLGLIQSSAQSLLVLLNDILDLSKIEAGKLEISTVDFDLHDTVIQVSRIAALSAKTKGLRFNCRIGPEVPRVVSGDPARLRQVINNLLGNAVKFTESGEISVDVASAAAADPFAIQVTISDTGIGIQDERLTCIFEPFRQADGSMTRRYGGTGLGLTISQRILELMGGRIWVESEFGAGSRFHFTAPFGRPLAEPAHVLRSLSGMRVGVVGADAKARRTAVEYLSADGAEVLEFASVRETQLSDGFDVFILESSIGNPEGICAETWGWLGRRVVICPPAEMLRHCNQSCIRVAAPYTPKELREAVGVKSSHGALPVAPWSTEDPRKLKVLLAEDNPINQALFLRTLTRRGDEVQLARNGLEALECIRRERYDIVLMDVQMPEMDGLEATAALRELERAAGSSHVPILALTANAMRGDREKCLAAGMDDYIAKPVRTADLCATIDRLVAGSGTTRMG